LSLFRSTNKFVTETKFPSNASTLDYKGKYKQQNFVSNLFHVSTKELRLVAVHRILMPQLLNNWQVTQTVEFIQMVARRTCSTASKVQYCVIKRNKRTNRQFHP